MPAVRKSLAMLTALVSALAIVAFAAPSAGAAGSTVWVAKPMCAAATPGHRSCLGMRLVRERATGAEQGGVRAGSARPALSDGPAGGYTPAQLAKAYGVNVGAAAASTQTVAIVDAFDDPSVKPDLAAFDTFYGIAAETPSSFRVVNQAGVAGPLPAPDAGWAGEITLDVQAVRGLCRRCKILLVEADSSSNDDLAAAVDEAVTLGAKEVSNSYGGPETDGNTAMVRASYNHHGVAITASTGDDGWYGWDRFNEGVPSDEVPSAPASFNTVVGVGGTSLYLNPNATRAGEQVWNTNGPSDIWGSNFGAALGAAGSGCSTLFAPQRWQRFVAGYGTLGCGSSLRSGVDIAADADPFTGFDVFQTYPNVTGSWETVGGTSLSSPLVAAMWALAGGPRGVTYPSLSLYGHFKGDTKRPTYDVSVGGTGLCDTSTITACSNAAGGNPNDLGAGLVDCAFPSAGAGVLANRAQCYAQTGYDGVSGVGTPAGVRVFTPDGPTAAIKPPGTVTHGAAKVFSAAGSRDPFPGGSITTYRWNWGDGHSTTTTGATASHTYASKGTHTITLTVTDNYGRTGRKTRTIAVS